MGLDCKITLVDAIKNETIPNVKQMTKDKKVSSITGMVLNKQIKAYFVALMLNEIKQQKIPLKTLKMVTPRHKILGSGPAMALRFPTNP